MKEPYHFADPCPNCGQKDEEETYKGARMSATSWGHSVPCCSDKCGIEYARKLNRSGKPKRIIEHRDAINRLERDLRLGRL